MIVVLQIGNSDNKLTQQEWSQFVYDLRKTAEPLAIETHFFAPSPGDLPWQNACIIFSVREVDVETLQEQVGELKKKFRQEWIAAVLGDVRRW